MTQDNYNVCQQLVHREVVQCVSYLVSHFARNPEACCGDVDYDDVLNLCSQRVDNSDRLEELSDEIDEIDDELETLEESEADDAAKAEHREQLTAKRKQLRAELLEKLEEYDGDDVEALEHWIVSDWFAERLKERGEIVGELLGLTIWGRTCSGQAIALDGVIESIARDMEILPGQKNDWSK